MKNHKNHYNNLQRRRLLIVFAIVTVLLSSETVVEGRLGFGKCPQVKFMPDLDKEAYSGRWYTILRDDKDNPFHKSRCDRKECKLRADGDLEIHAHIQSGKSEKDKKGFHGTLSECGDNPDSSTCKIKNDKWKKAKEYPYNIISTDYKNYDIYHYCWPIAWNAFHWEALVIGSRTKELP